MPDRVSVVIIDDEVIICERLKPALEKVGFEVETFTDSLEAQRRLGEKSFDIVVTDLRMKGLDGLQILRNVKASSAQTAVIVITAFATVDTAREALKIGAYDFIAKPFKIRDLRNIILKAAQEMGKELPA